MPDDATPPEDRRPANGSADTPHSEVADLETARRVRALREQAQQHDTRLTYLNEELGTLTEQLGVLTEQVGQLGLLSTSPGSPPTPPAPGSLNRPATCSSTSATAPNSSDF
jgi:hypothetical protein